MSELFIALANKRSKSAEAYPHSRRSDDVDYYHGEAIPDPYRRLEDATPQTAAWVAAQNRLTQAWLDGAPAPRLRSASACRPAPIPCVCRPGAYECEFRAHPCDLDSHS